MYHRSSPPESARPASMPLSSDVLERLRGFFVQHCSPPQLQTALPLYNDDGTGTMKKAAAGDSTTPVLGGRQLWTQEIDCMTLVSVCWELGDLLFHHTLELIDLLRAECVALCAQAGHVIVPRALSIRFTHLPSVSSALPSLPSTRGQLVQLCGSIVRMTAKRVIPFIYRVMCPRCHSVTEVYSDPYDRGAELKPCCAHPACKKESQQIVGQVWMDYAECRLQQRSNQSGQLPSSVQVTLDDDLSTRCTVGQFVEVIGMLFPKWRHVHPYGRPVIEPTIWAIHVLPMEAYRGAALVSGGNFVSSGNNYRSSNSAAMYSRRADDDEAEADLLTRPRSSRQENDEDEGKDPFCARAATHGSTWKSSIGSSAAYDGTAAPCRSSSQSDQVGRGDELTKFSPDRFYLSFRRDKRRRGVALARSVCAQLAGLFAPRMAILLSAVGGANTRSKSPLMHIRSTIHCLFVGDPSTGKSQLLQFAAAVAPRSTSTTGMSSTSAGLTVAATKEMGEWVLEPGALVLSDGGSCIIDELRTVSPADRSSLHEAMEQQTLSVAKGGLVTKLRTACAVLAACNPPSSSNRRNGGTHSSLLSSSSSGVHCMEVGVGGPLLSRFDFIFLLWDTPHAAQDACIADHVLSCNIATHRPEPPLAMDELARYLWWVRGQYAQTDNRTGGGGPLLRDEAADLLAMYYDMQRARGAAPALQDAVPVTVRMLESLVRCTQAHAKLHLQPLCTIDDAAFAIFLMERTAHSLKCPLGILGEGVYSSLRELDDIFLSDTPECMAQQDAVLAALVHTIRQYHRLPRNGGSCEDGDSGNNSSSSSGNSYRVNVGYRKRDCYDKEHRNRGDTEDNCVDGEDRNDIDSTKMTAYRVDQVGDGTRKPTLSVPRRSSNGSGDTNEYGASIPRNRQLSNSRTYHPSEEDESEDDPSALTLLRSEHDEVSLLDQRKQQRPHAGRRTVSTTASDRGGRTPLTSRVMHDSDEAEAIPVSPSERITSMARVARTETVATSTPLAFTGVKTTPAATTVTTAAVAGARSLARDIHTPSAAPVRSFVQYAEEAYTPARALSAQQLLDSQRVTSLPRRDYVPSPYPSSSSASIAAAASAVLSSPSFAPSDVAQPSAAVNWTSRDLDGSATTERTIAAAKRPRSMDDIVDSLRFHF